MCRTFFPISAFSFKECLICWSVSEYLDFITTIMHRYKQYRPKIITTVLLTFSTREPKHLGYVPSTIAYTNLTILHYKQGLAYYYSRVYEVVATIVHPRLQMKYSLYSFPLQTRFTTLVYFETLTTS